MIRVLPDPSEVLRALAEYFVMLAADSLQTRGRFDVALSGGSSPRALYKLLSSNYRDKVDWTRVYFFLGDERYVPNDHADSNYNMVRQTLLDPLGISDPQRFPVQTNLSPPEAAADYESRITRHFGAEPVFDLILLGLGDNSHTASLFPYTPILHETKALVRDVFVEEVDMYRITFTAPLINQARHIAFLVYGGAKAVAVHHIIEGHRNSDEFPAQLINPVKGDLIWFLDEPAARNLSQ